jgi:hypothetical protein
MKWSNLFLLTAVASVTAPVAPADDPTATVVEGKPLNVTVWATAEAASDAGSQPQRVVFLADETVDASAAPADAKAIRIRVVGDGQSFVFEGNAAAGAEAKQVPFIGVVTSPLGEAVRAQTNLTEDVGLAVEVVSPDSPAAKAGLKAHDILAKYDDQILCAAVQLSALVKRTGTGNKATLTVLRGGKEMPIEVIVGEHAAQATVKVEGLDNVIPLGGQSAIVAGQRKLLEEQGLNLWLSQAVKGGNGMSGAQYGFVVPEQGDAPIIPQSSAPLDTPAQVQGNQIQRNQRIVLVNPNVQSQSQSMTVFTDDDGRVELRETNGDRRVTISDKAGMKQYEGALNTPADREAIPEALRSRVEQAEASAVPKVAPPTEPVRP